MHLRRVRDAMHAVGVSAFYATSEGDIRYLSGHDTGRVLVTNDCARLWVRDVYAELYDSTYSVRGYPLDVRVYDEDDVKGSLRAMRAKTVAVSACDYVDKLKKASRRRVVVCDVAGTARAVKTRGELELIRRSCRIAKAGMRKAREVVDVGVRELDAVAEVEAFLRRRGSEEPPFGGGMLLASGRRSADIHAKPSTGRIGRGPVVVDLGAVYSGYYSDMTRTLAVGELTSEEKHVSSFVKHLRDEALDHVRCGVLASSVHRFVDERIKSGGFRLHHLAGHGVGLEIHEKPSFSPDCRVRLAPGMVFTVEPGVYLPHKFGVRFEDTVVLTKRGCRKLT